MQRLILRLLFVVAAIRYPRFRWDRWYFVRDNYFGRLAQVRFFQQDYLTRKPYKVIDYQSEFQQELLYVLPFAYWHHQNGTLKQTISCSGTSPFYFFSPNHVERYTYRDWRTAYERYDVPNMPHSPTFGFGKWAQVPLKSHYRNDWFVYKNPILIIANKYNVEWDNPPINFLDLPTLDQLINTLGSRFQLIYNRPLPARIVGDNSETLDLHEHDWLRQNHPEVLLMEDIYAQNQHRINSFNHLQLMVYANAERFISMHGGTAALASYFGGINIILSYPGSSLEAEFNEYATIFPAVSGATILHARSRSEVLTFIDKL